MSIPSFNTDKIFRDLQNFPYGFARSGEFTTEQAMLLEKHGLAYKELDSGDRQPADNQEKAFVAYCRGDKKAESLHERTWERFQNKIKRSQVSYSL